MGIQIANQELMGRAGYILHEAFESKYRKRLVKFLRAHDKDEVRYHIRTVVKKLSRPDLFTKWLVDDVCNIIDHAMSNCDDVANEFELGRFYELCTNLIEGQCWSIYKPADLPAWLRQT